MGWHRARQHQRHNVLRRLGNIGRWVGARILGLLWIIFHPHSGGWTAHQHVGHRHRADGGESRTTHGNSHEQERTTPAFHWRAVFGIDVRHQRLPICVALPS